MYKRILYIVGPAGSGKTTIMDILCTRYGYDLVRSRTTDTEMDDCLKVTYDFISIGGFKIKSDSDKLAESNKYGGNFYDSNISTVIKNVDDSSIAVRIIDIEELLKLLESDFHSNHNMDYLIAYIRPTFKGFEDIQRNQRIKKSCISEDGVQYKKIKSYFCDSGVEDIGRFRLFFNNDDIELLAATINEWCMFKDRDHRIEHGIVRLPSYVTLDKNNSNSNCSITFIDSKFSTIRNILYLHSKQKFNPIDFFKCKFDTLVSCCGDSYVVVSLDKYGVVAVVNKEVA